MFDYCYWATLCLGLWPCMNIVSIIWSMYCVPVSEEHTGELLLFAQLVPGSFLLLFQALVSISQDLFVWYVRQRVVRTVSVLRLRHVHCG